jgi:hypothetical protein
VTEAEWLACEAPDVLLRFLHGRASERKLRLCAVHVARLVATSAPTKPLYNENWAAWLNEPRWLDWLDAAERLADGALTPNEVRAIRHGSGGPHNLYRVACSVKTFSILHVAMALNSTAAEFGSPPVREACAVIRDVVDPFHQRTVCSSLLTADDGAALRLAWAIYDQREVNLMPLLGDALEDAGCADDAILSHLRGPGPHVRGCWAVDLILGKA